MKTKNAAVVAGLATLLMSHTIAHAQYAYKTLSFPLPLGDAFLGIDGANIVGTFQDTGYAQHGFVYDGTNYTTLDDPLAGLESNPVYHSEGTWASGVSGTNIVGYYQDKNYAYHGFLYNGASWATLDRPGAAGTYAQGISGASIVGSFTDTNGVTHGFAYDGVSWTTLDYPGAEGTSAQGVSGSNVVGSFTDTNGVSHGFFYNGATWTTLNAPMGSATYAEGISGANIAGYYSDSAGTNHGFLYNGGTWTTLDDPLAADGTDARGVSGSNIVGNWRTNDVNPAWEGGAIPISHGFLYTAGRYQTLDEPLNSLPTSTVATGIEGTNIVGYYIWAYYGDSGFGTQLPWRSFLYNGSAWRSFADPLGVQSEAFDGQLFGDGLATPLGTVATGISGTNIVGYYFDTNFTAHGVVYSGGAWTTLDDPFATRGTFPNGISGSNIVGSFSDTNSAGHGFLYSGGAWTTLDDPLANQGTSAFGVSGSNIVGQYNSSNVTHGFLYNGSTWTTLDAPMGVGTYPHGISGANIVGYYTDTNEVAHGFLYDGSKWTVLDAPGAGSTRFMGTFPEGISGSNIVGYFVNVILQNSPRRPRLSGHADPRSVHCLIHKRRKPFLALQENANLTTANWTSAPGVRNNGTNNSVTISPSAQAMFFRLMLQ